MDKISLRIGRNLRGDSNLHRFPWKHAPGVPLDKISLIVAFVLLNLQRVEERKKYHSNTYSNVMEKT